MTPSPRRIILLGSLLASLAAAFADPLPLPNARLPDAAPLPPMVVTPGGQRLLLDYTDATLTLDPATGALAGNKPGWWFINYPPDRIAGLDPAGLPSLLTRLGGRSGEVKNWYWKQKYDPAVSAPAPEPARPDGPVPVRLSRAPDYVVNPTHPHSGDNGPGTAERPFKTLAAALRVARPGVTLHVHPGVYREKIDLAANGTANAPIRVEGIRGSHGEWPVISGNLPFPPDAWSPVPGIDGVWRAPLFTRLEGMLSADLAEGNVTLVERGRPQDLLPGEYAFNRGSDEALRPLFDPAAPLAAQNTQGRSWHHLATDEDGMLDLEKAFGASAHNAVIWISARVWLDPSSRPQGEVWDPRNPEPVTGRVSFGGPFRAARQTGSGPGSQSHALTLYLNGDYIEPVTHRLNPPPEGAVQASANRNYGISDRWNSLPFREGWNTLLLQLDTTASTRKPLRFRLGLPEKRLGISNALPPLPPPPPSPAGDGKKPDGKPAAFVTEFLVLDPIPAKAQPSVFVRLPRDIDPNTVAVDLSALTSPLVRLSGRHTWFRGFEVRHGASYQQRALVDASAPGALLEGCRIHDGEVRGIALSAKSEPDQPPLIIRGNHVARTGHLGIGGIGNSAAEASAENQAAPAAVAAIIEHNLVEDTNWAGYSQLWESGGIKLLRLVGAQIRFNHIRRSGLGIWLDWENYGNRIESNLFEDTAAFAIGIEASPGPNLAANNIVLGLSPGPVWFRAGLLTWDGTRTQFIHNLVDTRGLAGTRWQGGDTAYGYSHGNNTTTRRTRWCPLPPPRQMTFLNNVSLGARNAIVTRAVETLNAGNATDHGRGAKPLPGLQSLPLGAPGDYAARLAAVAPAAASHPQADAVTFDYFGLPRHAPGVPAIAGPFRAPLPPPPAASVLEIEFSDTTITRHEY